MADRGGWEKMLLGGKKSQPHSPDKQHGEYGYYRLKMRSHGVQVVAEVYPDFERDRWLWGIKWPEQSRLVGYNGDTGQSEETRPYRRALMIGGHSVSLLEAQAAAEAQIKAGRPDSVDSSLD